MNALLIDKEPIINLFSFTNNVVDLFEYNKLPKSMRNNFNGFSKFPSDSVVLFSPGIHSEKRRRNWEHNKIFSYYLINLRGRWYPVVCFQQMYNEFWSLSHIVFLNFHPLLLHNFIIIQYKNLYWILALTCHFIKILPR